MIGHPLAVTIPIGEPVTHVGPFGLYTYDILGCAVAGAIVLGLGFYLRAKVTSGVPGKLQLFFEAVVGWVNGQVAASMGEAGESIVPLAVTLFFMILFANALELIPTGHDPQYLPAPTGDINFPAAMAVLVFVCVHYTWIRRQGLRRYVKHFFQPPAMFLINIIETITQPITLTLRLFGNIFAGGLLLVLIADLLPAKFIAPIPILDVVWKLFDGFFVGPVQAFIFTLLTMLYFQAAIAGEH